MQSVGYQMMTI